MRGDTSEIENVRSHNITAPIRFLRGTHDPMAYWFRCKKSARQIRPATCQLGDGY